MRGSSPRMTIFNLRKIDQQDCRAAVDHHRLAGHEIAGGRAEEHRSARDFIRDADAQQRRACGESLQVIRIVPQAPWLKSVLIRPGAMQFTRTLCGPYSQARLRASCISAAFEIA